MKEQEREIEKEIERNNLYGLRTIDLLILLLILLLIFLFWSVGRL